MYVDDEIRKILNEKLDEPDHMEVDLSEFDDEQTKDKKNDKNRYDNKKNHYNKNTSKDTDTKSTEGSKLDKKNHLERSDNKTASSTNNKHNGESPKKPSRETKSVESELVAKKRHREDGGDNKDLQKSHSHSSSLNHRREEKRYKNDNHSNIVVNKTNAGSRSIHYGSSGSCVVAGSTKSVRGGTPRESGGVTVGAIMESYAWPIWNRWCNRNRSPPELTSFKLEARNEFTIRCAYKEPVGHCFNVCAPNTKKKLESLRAVKVVFKQFGLKYV